jgi:mRNA interferase MazF
MSAPEPNRGDIWSINLDPTVGRAQAGTRPALVVSVDKFNHGPADLVVVLPVTSKDKNQPIHVPVKPPEGGLSMLSFVKWTISGRCQNSGSGSFTARFPCKP